MPDGSNKKKSPPLHPFFLFACGECRPTCPWANGSLFSLETVNTTGVASRVGVVADVRRGFAFTLTTETFTMSLRRSVSHPIGHPVDRRQSPLVRHIRQHCHAMVSPAKIEAIVSSRIDKLRQKCGVGVAGPSSNGAVASEVQGIPRIGEAC